MRSLSRAVGVVCCVLVSACGPTTPSTVGRFGEVTSAVVVVNPVINQGSSTSVTPGPQRANVEVRAGDGPVVLTDDTGLALLEDFGPGAVPFRFAPGSVDVNVVNPKELYDVVVSVTGSGVTRVLPDVRYPVGGTVVVVAPGEDLAAAVAQDDAIVVLQPGRYPGNLELRSEGVLLFGAWSPDDGPLSVIDGAVTVLGGRNRMRGLKVTGRLTSSANGFSVAFSDLGGANITGNGVTLIRNVFPSGQANVPSSSSILVDNAGLP